MILTIIVTPTPPPHTPPPLFELTPLPSYPPFYLISPWNMESILPLGPTFEEALILILRSVGSMTFSPHPQLPPPPYPSPSLFPYPLHSPSTL